MTEDGIVYGTPLMGTPYIGWTVSPGQAFAWSVDQQSIPNKQAVWYGDGKFDDVIDPETGGMYANATSYKTSFF